MAAGTLIPEDDGHVTDVDVAVEMKSSFLTYAYSVIYSRALPDARDGLKPVQRRILYQMGQMSLWPDRGHVKSARVVGEVMGRLHPHGESAIYDALVRMAQPFTMRLPFIDGHGNFGSPDDGPAAIGHVRYSTAGGSHAMGIYSPDQPSKGYEQAGYGRFRFAAEKVVKWNCVFRIRHAEQVPPGEYRYRMRLAVGTRDDVIQSLNSLRQSAGQ